MQIQHILFVTGMAIFLLLGCTSGEQQRVEPVVAGTEAGQQAQVTSAESAVATEAVPEVTVTKTPSQSPTLAASDSRATVTQAGPAATQTGVDEQDALAADVVSVQVSGQAGAYHFSVGVRSPDTGCEQYADWWEVLSEDGKLLYRRVLLHSHAGEQPFVRSGGPVSITADTVIWIRAHMNPGGYGGQVFKGSVASGFESVELDAGFASDLEQTEPLPTGCDF